MARPQRERKIKEPPRIQGFSPYGVPQGAAEQVVLTIDEFEAIRLADYEGLDQAQAAERMGISGSTFSRLIDRAHRKVGEAFAEVREIVIDGGSIHFRNNVYRCGNCGHIIRMGIESSGPQKCPSCGSLNVADLAQRFGHGRCCRRRWRGGRVRK